MKSLQIFFIQRSMYEQLLGKSFSQDDLVKLLESSSVERNVSPLTRAVIDSTDGKIKSVLFNGCAAPVACQGKYESKFDINEDQLTYVNSEVHGYLTEEVYFSDENTKCYEIVTYSTPDAIKLIVVVEKGFLSLVTTNPETLSSVYRELLRHSFGHDAYSFELNREYLGLKMNPGYFDLVKLRADRRS